MLILIEWQNRSGRIYKYYIFIAYINILTHLCYPWECRVYSENYQTWTAQTTVTIAHTWHTILPFCITAIIYYIIINASYVFIKSTYITTVYTKVLSTILVKYVTGIYCNPNAFQAFIKVPIITVIIKRCRQCKAGRESVITLSRCIDKEMKPILWSDEEKELVCRGQGRGREEQR